MTLVNKLLTNFVVLYSGLEIYFHKNNKICKMIFRIIEDSRAQCFSTKEKLKN